MLYIVTFTINIPQMLAYIPYMDTMVEYKKHIDVDLISNTMVIYKIQSYNVDDISCNG